MDIEISVVVPAFNEEKYIGSCLEALRRQSNKNCEIIVVDNGSTDSTPRIAQGLADRVVYESQKGVSRAKQRGLKEACGRIIAFTDADTIVSETWFEEIERGFVEGVAGVYGPVFLLDGTWAEKFLARYGFTLFLGINHLLGRPHVVGTNCAALRSVLETIGGFDVSLPSAEDVEMGYRVKKVGRVVFNPKMTVHTSARRLRTGYWRFFKHHTINYISMMLAGKTGRGFDDIR